MIRPVYINQSLLEHYSPLLTDYEWVTISLEALLTALVLVLNSMVAFVIVRSPVLRLCPSNLCILSLNLSDLFGGISDAIILMTLILDELLGAILTCRIRYFMAITWILSSLHSLLSITVDRIIAVCCPLRYSVLVTNSRLMAAMALLWALAACVGSVSLVWSRQAMCAICDPVLCLPNPYLIYFCVHCLVIIIVIFVCYAKIYSIAKRQSQRTQVFLIDRDSGLHQFWQKKRYVRTLVLVFSVIIFFILPIVLIIIIELANGITIRLQNARIIASLICQSTAILNPIVYIWRNRQFVASYRKLFGDFPFKR